MEIMKWETDRIDLTGGISVTGTSAADRVITDGGTEVLRGDSYLLPWAADGTFDATGKEPAKLYHYSAKGGTSTWMLPERFRQNGGYKLYKLTDTGRELVDQPRAQQGQDHAERRGRTALRAGERRPPGPPPEAGVRRGNPRCGSRIQRRVTHGLGPLRRGNHRVQRQRLHPRGAGRRPLGHQPAAGKA